MTMTAAEASTGDDFFVHLVEDGECDSEQGEEGEEGGEEGGERPERLEDQTAAPSPQIPSPDSTPAPPGTSPKRESACEEQPSKRQKVWEDGPYVKVTYANLSRESSDRLQELLRAWSAIEYEEMRKQEDPRQRHRGSAGQTADMKIGGSSVFFPGPALQFVPGHGRHAPTVPMACWWADIPSHAPRGGSEPGAPRQAAGGQAPRGLPKEVLQRLAGGSEVPCYDRAMGSLLGSAATSRDRRGLTAVEGAGAQNSKPPTELPCNNRCFNCGSYVHGMRDCPRPRDHHSIAAARAQFNARKQAQEEARPAADQGPKRYHGASRAERHRQQGHGTRGSNGGSNGGTRGSNSNGGLSAESRAALGLRDSDLPPWQGYANQSDQSPGYGQEPEQDADVAVLPMFLDAASAEAAREHIPEQGASGDRDGAREVRDRDVDSPGLGRDPDGFKTPGNSVRGPKRNRWDLGASGGATPTPSPRDSSGHHSGHHSGQHSGQHSGHHSGQHSGQHSVYHSGLLGRTPPLPFSPFPAPPDFSPPASSAAQAGTPEDGEISPHGTAGTAQHRQEQGQEQGQGGSLPQEYGAYGRYSPVEEKYSARADPADPHPWEQQQQQGHGASAPASSRAGALHSRSYSDSLLGSYQGVSVVHQQQHHQQQQQQHYAPPPLAPLPVVVQPWWAPVAHHAPVGSYMYPGVVAHTIPGPLGYGLGGHERRDSFGEMDTTE